MTYLYHHLQSAKITGWINMATEKKLSDDEKQNVKKLFAAAFKNFFYSRLQLCESPGIKYSKDELIELNSSKFQKDQDGLSCYILKDDYNLENLVRQKVDLEFLGPNDVFIEVHYVGLNFSDIYSIKGLFYKKQLPYIPGIECSGIVLAVGNEVDLFTAGDKVMVFKPEGGLLREKVVVHKKCVFYFSDLRYGAAIPVNYLTAMEIIYSADLFKYFDSEKAGVNQEVEQNKLQKKILFHGCSGGVGSAFYDLSKCMDVKHLGTCSQSKHDLVNYECYHYENWDKEVRHKYPEGVDVVIETISGPNTSKSLDILRQNGHLFVIGATAALNENPRLEEGAFVSIEKLIMKNISVTGVNVQTLFENKPQYVRDVITFISSLYHEKIIKPCVTKVFEFDETVDAIQCISERKNVGKVLIRIKDEE